MDDRQAGPATSGRRRFFRDMLAGGAALAVAGGARAQSADSTPADRTTITNARVFDGRWLLEADSVAVENGVIVEVGRGLPARGVVVDARGGTLLPGLIDAHTHVHGSVDALHGALRFGVTTELEMNGDWTAERRRLMATDDQAADFRTSLLALTPPGGHPTELFPPGHSFPLSDISTVEEARAHVARIIERGADYVKLLIEDGRVFGSANLPQLSAAVIEAAIATAHARGRMVLAHALTQDAARRALAAGADGLAHLFLDRPAGARFVRQAARSGAFMIPTLGLASSIMGRVAVDLARDPRVASKLSAASLDSISGTIGTFPSGRFSDVLASFAALREAGVELLVGTDATVPTPRVHGLAHGASVHGELQLFVQAGCTPIEALRAATSSTARRFDLNDRGQIAQGLRADLLLVDGDPTQDISATLSIRGVWKRGVVVQGIGRAPEGRWGAPQ